METAETSMIMTGHMFRNINGVLSTYSSKDEKGGCHRCSVKVRPLSLSVLITETLEKFRQIRVLLSEFSKPVVLGQNRFVETPVEC